MTKACLLLIPGGLLVAGLTLVLMLFLVKVLWAWTIPDILPGAVAQGLVAKELSWYTAFKLSVFVAVLAGGMYGAVQKCS